MPITACSVALATALAVSTIHPATVAVPHALQAQRMMREVEHDLATDDYNDAYTLSFSRLHMSRATFLAHTPHAPFPQGSVVKVTETGPWRPTAIGKPAIIEVAQPIQVYVHVPGRKASTSGYEIMLIDIKDHWYWEV